jgi:hypothetical protein
MIEYTTQEVTPILAEKLLAKNTNNRNLKPRSVERYSNDMKNGLWKKNTAEFIKISADGRVLDGQHRLVAICKAGVTVSLDVAYNVPEDVFSVLDTGSKRSFGDAFRVAGVQNANTVAGIISFYNALNSGFSIRSKKHLDTSGGLLEDYGVRPYFWDNVCSNGRRLYHSFSKVLPPQFLGGFYAKLSESNPFEGASFMEELATGADISNSTVLYLRNYLIRDRLSAKKLPIEQKAALTIKAWNYYIKGRSVKKISFNPINENYPKLIIN